MTVGKAPHVILGQEMLKPRDGAEKDEGELTGGKRLVEQLRKRHIIGCRNTSNLLNLIKGER